MAWAFFHIGRVPNRTVQNQSNRDRFESETISTLESQVETDMIGTFDFEFAVI